MADQLDLFGSPVAAPSSRQQQHRPQRPTRSRRPQNSARPEVAADVLADVHHGRYGLLDDGDRYVVFEDDTKVRLAPDDNVLASLVANGYVERRPARDTVSCKHGAIRRPVTPLRLTKSGHALMHRWSALAPYGTDKRRKGMAVTDKAGDDGLTEEERLDMAAAVLWDRLPSDARRDIYMHMSAEEQAASIRGVKRGRRLLREARNRAKNSGG